MGLPPPILKQEQEFNRSSESPTFWPKGLSQHIGKKSGRGKSTKKKCNLTSLDYNLILSRELESGSNKNSFRRWEDAKKANKQFYCMREDGSGEL